ncbi:MAG: HAMP domain-containing protein [Paucibacter sp.]|nr:HAMP domain-containing protein [Roseateles sp.]
MQLRQKIPFAFTVAIVVTLVASMLGAHRLHQANEVYAQVIEVDEANKQQVAEMLIAFKTQVQEWKDTLLRGKDPAKLDKYWGNFQARERDVDAIAEKLEGTLGDGEAKELVRQFVEAHRTMGERYRAGLDAFKSAGFESAAGDAAVAGMDRAPAELLLKARAKIEEGVAASVTVAEASSRNARMLSTVLMVAAALAGVLGGVLFGRALVRPLAEAVVVAEAVASGDLSQDVRVNRADELGQMLLALQHMNDSLLKMVGNVRDAADCIATGSSQIAVGNADLSQRTEDQASNLQKTAASMEQLTATVKHNAETARMASELAAGASAVAARGGEVVGQVVSTMGEISASSKKIADIIGVIDGIAFQTNILALNAAVEAARAGEQGRGFAVVASEVRSLAQRSAQAAKEIKTLIGESVTRVESGTHLVDNAGQTMGDIVAQIKRVADMIGEISASSSEQSAGIDQIGEAVNELDQVTQQNAALVEESAAAAESLKQQADVLARVVAAFRLRSPG